MFLAGSAAVIGWLITQLLFHLGQRKREELHQRLSSGSATQAASSAYRPIVLPKEEDNLRALLAQKRMVGEFSRKLGQAYPGVTLARFLFVEMAVILGTFAITGFVTGSLVMGVLLAGFAALLPVAIVNIRRAKRQRVCDDQLPEALDFLARILRAGHSFATALQMAGEELPDPLAAEYRKIYDQNSVGQTMEAALRDAASRVDTQDFAFFVTAVLIQRQTGGDLAEVLSNIGAMARSRIRLQQHVKAITAEGRLVGYILLALPFIFFMVLYALNPKYAGVLLTDPMGRWVLIFAGIMQALGLFTIRMIVNVRL
jgi:tight adherence protein B